MRGVVETREKIKNKCKENIRNAVIQLINSKPPFCIKDIKGMIGEGDVDVVWDSSISN